MRYSARDIVKLQEKCLMFKYAFPKKLEDKDITKTPILFVKGNADGTKRIHTVQLGAKREISEASINKSVANIELFATEVVRKDVKEACMKNYKENLARLINADILEKEQANEMLADMQNVFARIETRQNEQTM